MEVCNFSVNSAVSTCIILRERFKTCPAAGDDFFHSCIFKHFTTNREHIGNKFDNKSVTVCQYQPEINSNWITEPNSFQLSTSIARYEKCQWEVIDNIKIRAIV